MKAGHTHFIQIVSTLTKCLQAEQGPYTKIETAMKKKRELNSSINTEILFTQIVLREKE